MAQESIRSVHIIGSKTLGGAERFMGRLVNAFNEQGEDVHAIVRLGGEMDAILDETVSRSYLPMRTMWDSLSKFEISCNLKRLEPQIVQTYMGRATRLTHVDKNAGVKHIARLGGYYKIKGYNHADAWVGNTKGLCDYLVQQGLPADRVFHITNFIDPAKLVTQDEQQELRQQLLVPNDAWLLMTFARFVPVKALPVLLDAIAKLPELIADRPVRMVIVGDGPDKENLLTQARQLDIEDKIIWAGWQTEPAPYYQLADLVVFPSNEEETLGNVILEAWSYAKPLLTTRSRGGRELTQHAETRELTQHAETAWQVDCGDSEGLAAGICEMLADKTLCQTMITNGQQQLEQTFSKAAVLKAYRDLYKNLLRL